MMLAFTPEYRPPLITVPQFLFMVALLAAIIALSRWGTRRRKRRSTDGASSGSSSDPV
jgi:hypothetical protein